jgi:16S rRNA (uracil1498-N3)-methyltransferase
VTRIFVESAQLGLLPLNSEQSHYLADVLRHRVGDSISVFDGVGGAYDAQVERMGQGQVVLRLTSKQVHPLSRPLTIIQSLPKGDKLDFVLQKCTELGVSTFVLAQAARSVSRVDAQKVDAKLSRWSRVVQEAARQCGRDDVPTVLFAPSLADGLKLLTGMHRLLVLDEEESTHSLASTLSQTPSDRGVAVVVGPEGGLTRDEVSLCRSQNGQPVTLGRRILRTETAGMVAATICRLLDGELGLSKEEACALQPRRQNQ